MSKFEEINKLHQLRLQLSSEQLLDLYAWLNNQRNLVDHIGQLPPTAVDILRGQTLSHILANLDECKKPYVAIDDDIVIPLTSERLQEIAFGNCEFDKLSPPASRKANPDEHLKDLHDTNVHDFNDSLLDKDAPQWPTKEQLKEIDDIKEHLKAFTDFDELEDVSSYASEF